eukprot:jgi/Chrzof1/1996/Cz10g29040.t1
MLTPQVGGVCCDPVAKFVEPRSTAVAGVSSLTTPMLWQQGLRSLAAAFPRYDAAYSEHGSSTRVSTTSTAMVVARGMPDGEAVMSNGCSARHHTPCYPGSISKGLQASADIMSARSKADKPVQPTVDFMRTFSQTWSGYIGTPDELQLCWSPSGLAGFGSSSRATSSSSSSRAGTAQANVRTTSATNRPKHKGQATLPAAASLSRSSTIQSSSMSASGVQTWCLTLSAVCVRSCIGKLLRHHADRTLQMCDAGAYVHWYDKFGCGKDAIVDAANTVLGVADYYTLQHHDCR